jgi:hypothetical protein
MLWAWKGGVESIRPEMEAKSLFANWAPFKH